MGEVVGFGDRRVQDPLVVAIRVAIAAQGSVSQELDTLTVPVADWRRAARTACRGLGRPVQTLVTADAVHAVLRDWPRDEHEKKIHTQALRDISDAMALAAEVCGPIPPCPSCGHLVRTWRQGTSFGQSGATICDECGLVEVAPVR